MMDTCYHCWGPVGTSKLMRCNHLVHLSCLSYYISKTKNLECLLCGSFLQATDIMELISVTSDPQQQKYLRGKMLEILVLDLLPSDWDDSHLY